MEDCRKKANQLAIVRKETPPEAAAAWASAADPAEVLKRLDSTDAGLSSRKARGRLDAWGPNEVVTERRKPWYRRLWDNIKDPLSALLFILGIISVLTGDIKAAVIIGVMLAMSVSLRLLQEARADAAAEKLKAMVRTTTAVVRDGVKKEIPLDCLVPGDIVHLSAGDMVPADIRLLSSRDLFVNQASLTGESLPVEKHADAPAPSGRQGSDFDLVNICFMGTSVGSGTAIGVVLATAGRTHFGALAARLAAKPPEPTSFDRGIDRYTWLMVRFVAIMVPAVFFINGFTKGDWFEAFLFAVAVAVGLTPELLPMIVTVNLSKGALEMSRRKVIVKRLNAIQDFGAMDVLCTDKTGTLTEGRVVLVKHFNIDGDEDESILDQAFLNSYFQTGLSNLLDDAILKHDGRRAELVAAHRKVDELPFDFRRRRMSVVVAESDGSHLLICKGAVEEILDRISHVQEAGDRVDLEADHHGQVQALVTRMSDEGFRLIALAVRRFSGERRTYSIADESDLTLLGFLAFLDPPKRTAAGAIRRLAEYGVAVKILTGDNELVTRKICSEVGLPVERVLLGSEIEAMSDDELVKAVEQVTVFDKLEPDHKDRVVRALQRGGHVVGFLGDGINDAPALKTADVGISVSGAADIAKESSDIILLERSLMVLGDGVIEGRRSFGNIIKYIKMTASSNFGNMFSVVGGSWFLPFLPMLPLQVIVNNLLYDFSQTTIPTDQVDKEYLVKPRRWEIGKIGRFILFIGPISSIFDYATYFLMLYVFDCWTDPALFHTGWFVESLLTQTLIIHIIRTSKIPFFQSRASHALTLTTLAIAAIGIWLPYSPLAAPLGFAPLPAAYWGYIALFLAAYFVLTQVIKQAFIRKFGWD